MKRKESYKGSKGKDFFVGALFIGSLVFIKWLAIAGLVFMTGYFGYKYIVRKRKAAEGPEEKWDKYHLIKQVMPPEERSARMERLAKYEAIRSGWPRELKMYPPCIKTGENLLYTWDVVVVKDLSYKHSYGDSEMHHLLADLEYKECKQIGALKISKVTIHLENGETEVVYDAPAPSLNQERVNDTICSLLNNDKACFSYSMAFSETLLAENKKEGVYNAAEAMGSTLEKWEERYKIRTYILAWKYALKAFFKVKEVKYQGKSRFLVKFDR